MTAKVLSLQKGWRWCRKCEGLFFIGNFFKWRCPAEGLHDHNGSGFYQLNSPRPVNHTGGDAENVKGYSLTPILQPYYLSDAAPSTAAEM